MSLFLGKNARSDRAGSACNHQRAGDEQQPGNPGRQHGPTIPSAKGESRRQTLVIRLSKKGCKTSQQFFRCRSPRASEESLFV